MRLLDFIALIHIISLLFDVFAIRETSGRCFHSILYNMAFSTFWLTHTHSLLLYELMLLVKRHGNIFLLHIKCFLDIGMLHASSLIIMQNGQCSVSNTSDFHSLVSMEITRVLMFSNFTVFCLRVVLLYSWCAVLFFTDLMSSFYFMVTIPFILGTKFFC